MGKLLKIISCEVSFLSENNNSNINDLLNNINNNNIDSEKLKNVLSDKNSISKLLSSPKAKELLKKFLGGK